MQYIVFYKHVWPTVWSISNMILLKGWEHNHLLSNFRLIFHFAQKCDLNFCTWPSIQLKHITVVVVVFSLNFSTSLLSFIDLIVWGKHKPLEGGGGGLGRGGVFRLNWRPHACKNLSKIKKSGDLEFNVRHCYIPRLSLNKTNTVIGWFLVMCPWSNTNISWPGYNSAVVTLPVVCLFVWLWLLKEKSKYSCV